MSMVSNTSRADFKVPYLKTWHVKWFILTIFAVIKAWKATAHLKLSSILYVHENCSKFIFFSFKKNLKLCLIFILLIQLIKLQMFLPKLRILKYFLFFFLKIWLESLLANKPFFFASFNHQRLHVGIEIFLTNKMHKTIKI